MNTTDAKRRIEALEREVARLKALTNPAPVRVGDTRLPTPSSRFTVLSVIDDHGTLAFDWVRFRDPMIR